MRTERWKRLLALHPGLSEMSVVDLGGTERSWALAPVKPTALVLVNLPDDDACDPQLLAHEHFDLVYSNSVIEHVGGHWRRERFAENVHRLGDHHWIQTPNRYFPIEPHWLCPVFQHLPVTARAHLGRVWPIGNVARFHVPYSQSLELVLGIELLDASQMRLYFPESTIVRERFLGLTKSLIAVR
jgi:hypothetical protein